MRPFAAATVAAVLLAGCGAMIEPGTPPLIASDSIISRHGGVLGDGAVGARLNGLLARLAAEGAPGSEDWSAVVTLAETPLLDVLPGHRILLSRGFLQRAEDEAQVAGLLAAGMVEARLRASLPPRDEPADSAVAALDLPEHRRRMARRLSGFAGSETGDPSRTALSLVAQAGYEPGGLVELLSSLDAEARATNPALPGLAGLERALPSVRREFPGAKRRNARHWQSLRTTL